jgi:hypothetical protein
VCTVAVAGQVGPALTEPSAACPGGGDAAPPLDPQPGSAAATSTTSLARHGNGRMGKLYTLVAWVDSREGNGQIYGARLEGNAAAIAAEAFAISTGADYFTASTNSMYWMNLLSK